MAGADATLATMLLEDQPSRPSATARQWVPLPDARTRIHAEHTVPMQERRRPRMRRLRPARSTTTGAAGADRALGHGSNPMNASPITISTKPAILTCACSSTPPPIAAAPAPSSTKTLVEAEDERDARDHDPPADAALAEPVDLDGRDRREIARQERQHARRDHRHQPREERDRELLKLFQGRAPRRPAARPGPSATGAAARGSARVLDHARAPSANVAAASAPPSGITHASRSKPLVLGVERIVGPNSSTIASRICRSDWQPAIRRFTSDVSRATSESDSSNVVPHDGDEQRLQPPRASNCGGRERKRKRGHCDEPHDLSASRMPASSSFVEAGPVAAAPHGRAVASRGRVVPPHITGPASTKELEAGIRLALKS